MKNYLIKFLKNSKGNLLVESLVSAGVLSVIFLTIVSFFQSATIAKAKIQSTMEFQNIRYVVKGALSNKVLCDSIFNGKEIDLTAGVTNAIPTFQNITINGTSIVPDTGFQQYIQNIEFNVSDLTGPVDYNGTQKLYRMNVWISAQQNVPHIDLPSFRKSQPLTLIVETAASPATIVGCITEECN